MLQFRIWAAVALAATATGATADSADKFFDKVRRENLETLARSKKAEERARAAESLGSWDDAQSVAALTRALDDPDAEVRENAAGSLWRLYKVAGSAEAALRARLEDIPDVAVVAAGALEAIGVDQAELLPARRRALEAGGPWPRYLAARSLIGHAPGARLLPPILDQYFAAAAADDVEATTRRDEAFAALQELAKTQDRTLIPPLMDALGRVSPQRKSLLRILGSFEPPPEDWRDFLIARLGVMDTPVQGEALAQLVRRKDEVDVRAWVPAVGRLLGNRGLRRDAIDALATAGPIAHEHAATIAGLLLKGNEKERRSAAAALGKIGDRRGAGTQAIKQEVARVALPALQEALREDLVRDVRVEAARSLDSLQLDPSVAALAMAEAVARPGEEGPVRGALLFALKNRGGEAKAAVPVLEAFLPQAGDSRQTVTDVLESIRSGKVREATLPLPGAGKDADAEARAHSYLRAKGVAFEEHQFAMALFEADLQLVAAFLDAGMSANHKFTQTFNQPPLGTLMRWGPCSPQVRPTPDRVREIVELLLASGADVNGTDDNKFTPLIDASMKGCDRVVIRTLLKAGARMDAKEWNGGTAFEGGLIWGHDGLDELIAAGYRLSPARSKELLAIYADDPKALAYIRKASAPAADRAAARTKKTPAP